MKNKSYYYLPVISHSWDQAKRHDHYDDQSWQPHNCARVSAIVLHEEGRNTQCQPGEHTFQPSEGASSTIIITTVMAAPMRPPQPFYQPTTPTKTVCQSTQCPLSKHSAHPLRNTIFWRETRSHFSSKNYVIIHHYTLPLGRLLYPLPACV